MGVRPRGSDYDAPADPRSFRPAVLPGAVRRMEGLRVQLHRRRGRAQRPPDLAYGPAHDPRHRVPLGRGAAPARLLRPLHVPRDGPRGRVPGPGLLPLPGLLAARPPPDVLPHRDLGRPEPAGRGADVPGLTEL